MTANRMIPTMVRVCFCASGLLFASPARGAAPGADAVSSVIETLRKEITDWSKDRTQTPPREDWGHPEVQKLQGTDPVDVLARVRRPIRGTTRFEALYIRWQLLWLAVQVPPDKRRELAEPLTVLFRTAPKPVRFQHYPEQVVRQIRRIWDTLPHEHVGYWPFSRHTINYDKIRNPREREKLRNDEKAMRQMIAQIDRKIGKVNAEARQANRMVVAYQSRLAGLMVSTGDAKALDTVFDAIQKYLQARDHLAFSLLASVYAAGFDGAFKRYDPGDLERLGKRLQVMRTRYKGMIPYKPPTRYRHWHDPYEIRRDFDDATFHLSFLIRQATETEQRVGKR